MSESTWDRAKRIFHDALERGPEERAAHVEEACAGDAALRDEVERLLAAHAELDASVTPLDERHADVPKEGATIGRYKLLQQIGEGGFGTVYMAEQQEPVRRKVALKIIKLGMDTRQVVARFEAERQALALMDHPNIARVLDAGATENGRPYFVMELVRGIPITEYCDRHKLSTRERLELFLDVCSAVQHAHQKGVIHRDLKPTNVMVTLHDGRPVPKIIDFGIAKAMNQRLTEKTLFTAYEQFVGTPQYMSPEQAEMSGLDVDTRTDIYALGVLLYELMTGTTPFDARRLYEAGLAEIHRIIREEEPPRPSTRLSTLGAAATTTADHQRTDVAGLRRALKGDLDWIVMKALAKDRTRRFETANSLRMDIERHLASQPVLARPPSVAYRLRTFLRRHRTAVAVAAAMVLALVAGLALALAGLVQAQRERAVARAEAEAAEAINAFFSEMLIAVDPQQSSRHSAIAPLGQLADAGGASLEREISVADMLLRSRAGLAESFEGKPLLEAVARETIGMSLLGFGFAEPATEELQAAWTLRRDELPDGHPERLRSQVQLGLAHATWNRAGEATPLLEEAGRVSAALHGPDDARTLATRSAHGYALILSRQHEEGGAILEEALEAQRRVLGDDHPDTILTRLWLAESLQWRNQGAEAGRLTGAALEACRRALPPGDVLTMHALSNHGWSLNFQRRHAEAEALLREALAGQLRLVGSDHPWTALTKMGLGRSLQDPADAEEKERLWREAVDALRVTQGEASPTLYVIRRDLARLLLRSGKPQEGLQRLRATVQDFDEHYGAGHSWTVDLHHNLVSALFGERRVDEGLRELGRLRARLEGGPTERRARRASLALRFAAGLERLGRGEAALESGRFGLELREQHAASAASAAAFENAAWSYLTCLPAELRDPARALVLAREALAQLDEADENDRPELLDTLARAQFETGAVDEAIATQRQVLAHPAARESSRWDAWVAHLAEYLLEAGRVSQVEALLQREVAARRASDATGWASLDRLARVLVDRGVPAEAVIDAALEDCGHDEDCGAHDRGMLWNRRAVGLSWLGHESEALESWDRAIRVLESGAAPELLATVRLNRLEALASVGSLVQARPAAEDRLAACRAAADDCEDEERVLGSILLHAGELGPAEELLGSAARSERDDGWSGREWRIARAESLWGEALSRLARHAEAEPLLLSSHAALERERGPRFAMTRRARARVVNLYERWERPEALEEWSRRFGLDPEGSPRAR